MTSRAEVIAALKQNAFNVSATARALGLKRQTIQNHIKRALEKDEIRADDLKTANAAKTEDLADARRRKSAAFARKRDKGSWRKPVQINLPSGPFRLKLFGDPHLDADGCDFEMFLENFEELDPATGVYGICVGDWFNNWVRALAGLYAEETTRPSDAWLLFSDLVERHGEGLLAACSGNHDDWSHGPVDPVEDLMRRHGVIYRKGAVRVALYFDGLKRYITLSIRHKTKGHSQFAPSHALKKSALWGWRDNISVSGHTHVDEHRIHVHADDQFKQHLCQLSAFKIFDEYPDTHGFIPHQIKPVWDLVIDPRRSDDDPDMVKVFWEPHLAAAYLRAIQESNVQ